MLPRNTLQRKSDSKGIVKLKPKCIKIALGSNSIGGTFQVHSKKLIDFDETWSVSAYGYAIIGQ